MPVTLYDATLEHWPTVRIAVTVPASAEEVLSLIEPDLSASLVSQLQIVSGQVVPQPGDAVAAHVAQVQADWLKANPGKAAADFKVAYLGQIDRAIEYSGLLTKLVDTDRSTWLAAKPGKTVADYQEWFKSTWADGSFVRAFVAVDVKAEYFRLHGIETSHNPFTFKEVQQGDAIAAHGPGVDAAGFDKVRQQLGTVDRPATAVVMPSVPAPAQVKQVEPQGAGGAGAVAQPAPEAQKQSAPPPPPPVQPASPAAPSAAKA